MCEGTGGVRSPQLSPLPHLPSSCPPSCSSLARTAGGHTGDKLYASPHFQPPPGQGCNAAGGALINNRKGTFLELCQPRHTGTCMHTRCHPMLPCQAALLGPCTPVFWKRDVSSPLAAPGRMLKPPGESSGSAHGIGQHWLEEAGAETNNCSMWSTSAWVGQGWLCKRKEKKKTKQLKRVQWESDSNHRQWEAHGVGGRGGPVQGRVSTRRAKQFSFLCWV